MILVLWDRPTDRSLENPNYRLARVFQNTVQVFIVTVLTLVLVSTCSAVGDEANDNGDRPQVVADHSVAAANDSPVEARGSLVWVFSDELDFIGDMDVKIPFRIGASKMYFNLETTTAIEKTASDFTFIVRDLNYRTELGAEFDMTGTQHWSLFAGQTGQAHVDATGHAFVRFFGGGWAIGRDDPAGEILTRNWGLKLDAAVVLDDQRIDGDGIARGTFHYSRPWRSLEVGFDLSFDGLLGSGNFDADYQGGPRIGFVLPGGRRADLFVHYLDGNSPLGLRLSGVLAGIDLLESPQPGTAAVSPPDIDGVVGASIGDERTGGRLRLRIVSPYFANDYRAVLEVDGNILKDNEKSSVGEADELYYFYHLGVERKWRQLWTGVYFHHRSNHRLSEPNSTVTSINVLEAGLETDRYGRVRETAGFDWRFRAGYLVDSTFGNEDDWHVRGGARYLFPASFGRWMPFARVELEAGEVERQNYRLGLLHRSGVETWLEYLDDDQFFGTENDAFLIGGAFNF
jgi:hypothetical protein